MLKNAKFLSGSIGLAALLALSSMGAASAANLHSGAQMSVVPSLIEKADYRKRREIDGLYQCCWRRLRGQPLIGLYCGSAKLNQALQRDVIRIVVSANGQKVCTYGNRLHFYY